MLKGRGYGLYPMISQPTDNLRRVRQQFISKFLLVHFYFVLPQFQI